MARPDPLKEMLLDLSELHGFREEVAELVIDRPAVKVPPLGELLRDHRHRSGVSLAHVRRRCCIARSQLTGYESGKLRAPGIRTIHALSYGYRLPFCKVLAAALKYAHRVR